MGITKFDELNSIGANAKMVTVLPSTPYDYYDVSSTDIDAAILEWRGGELACIKTTTYRGMLYLQTKTSGRTAVWVRLLETLVTSTSTTTSTSTSSTTSTTSSTTSTSTSTSSTTTSTTSSSSTTTGGA